jgi:lipopolysaccharide export system permease protein
MKLLTWYIFRRCIFNTFLMLLAFIMLFSIFNVLSQISDVGKGSFTASSMLVYTALLIPNYVYLLMPLAILIGVMLSMLSLVNYSEYAIIRTSGLSLRRITAILFSFGITFSVITFLIGEVVAPQSNHFAQVYKISKTKQVVSTQLRSGIWSKDGNNAFVNIKQVLPDNTIVGVNILRYGIGLNLQYYVQAEDGHFNEQSQSWTLNNVTIYDYTGQNVKVLQFPHYSWKTSVVPSYFSVLVIAPEDMSAFGLLKYIHHLEENNQSTQRYQIAFWNKLLYPIACISMSLIALAFIPNNRRNINLGSKLFAGILIGISFFFITRLVGFMALLFDWNAVLSALTPTAILFILGWYFVLRKE